MGLRRRGVVIAGVCALVLLGVVVALAATGHFQGREDLRETTAANAVSVGTGANIVDQGGVSDEEALDKLREEIERSRITISVASRMSLAPNGELRVNFVVPEDNNGLSERLEVQQNGKVVYASGIVKPGESIEYVQSDGAVEGAATAIVRAVDEQGRDYGNPISSEVKIVAA